MTCTLDHSELVDRFEGESRKTWFRRNMYYVMIGFYVLVLYKKKWIILHSKYIFKFWVENNVYFLKYTFLYINIDRQNAFVIFIILNWRLRSIFSYFTSPYLKVWITKQKEKYYQKNLFEVSKCAKQMIENFLLKTSI